MNEIIGIDPAKKDGEESKVIIHNVANDKGYIILDDLISPVKMTEEEFNKHKTDMCKWINEVLKSRTSKQQRGLIPLDLIN